MEFIAIDVETANPDMSSICQIGLARYTNGQLTEEWKAYVDPEDFFNGMYVAKHGIDASIVNGAPNLAQIAPEITQMLSNRIVVSHTAYDRISLRKAFDKYKLIQPQCTWLDSARVTRKTWAEFADSGYGLANVCKHIGHNFKHHDALEDAKAAAQILLAAIEKSGVDLNGWLNIASKPKASRPYFGNTSVKREGNPEGDLYGEIIVFTGALGAPRATLADMAAEIGCTVQDNVNKQTTILVVGNQDIKLLAGHLKSSKHRKAEELIGKGQEIRIIGKEDFDALLAIEDDS